MGRVTFEALENSGDTVGSFSTIESWKPGTSHLGQEIQRTLTGTQVTVQPVALVDLRIVPQAIAVQPPQPFTFEIRVDPNGQTLTGVQVLLEFNPNSLQVVTIVTGTSSPLGNPLANRFDNSVCTLDIAAGTLGSGTNTQFTLAVVNMSGGASGVMTPVVFFAASLRDSAVSIEGDQIQ